MLKLAFKEVAEAYSQALKYSDIGFVVEAEINSIHELPCFGEPVLSFKTQFHADNYFIVECTGNNWVSKSKLTCGPNETFVDFGLRRSRYDSRAAGIAGMIPDSRAAIAWIPSLLMSQTYLKEIWQFWQFDYHALEETSYDGHTYVHFQGRDSANVVDIIVDNTAMLIRRIYWCQKVRQDLIRHTQ